jgi:hypothetical protein
MRQLKIELPTLKPGEVRQIKDSTGRNWEVERRPMDAAAPAADQTEFLVLNEIPRWDIQIEGFQIGSADSLHPGEAVRECFQAAGLTSLPEAVLVKAVSPEEQFAVFTLGGKAYSVPLRQFSEEVEKSGAWITARQARRPEIDALMIELRKLPRK